MRDKTLVRFEVHIQNFFSYLKLVNECTRDTIFRLAVKIYDRKLHVKQ